MSEKIERLGRLLAIRRLSEDLDRRDLALAMGSVAEVDAAIARQKLSRVDSGLAARKALESGDRGEWLLAEAQSEVAGWNWGRLDTLLKTRAAEILPAMEKFLASRLEHEQVKQLVEDARQTARAEQDHKAQAMADDWFLSRRSDPDD
jgi:hypothetical protein